MMLHGGACVNIPIPNLTPDEIRAVRERLGLTQIEASELIGGGRRSFTKYESGAVKPAASVVKLLLRLEAEPGTIERLKSRKVRSIPAGPRSPYEVEGADIVALTDRSLPQLLRRLLSAEALAHGLQADGIHVASNINAPDGGEDARIEWVDGPERTLFLPCRLNQFQSKAGQMTRNQAAKEVIGTRGTPKDMVRGVLEAGGTYIMVCGHPYNKSQIDDREMDIRTALRKAGLTLDDHQVRFRDADQIADWVNHYPTVAAWVKELTQPGVLGPFRSWSHWAGRAEHDRFPWIEDERLPMLRDHIRQIAAKPGGVARVLGQSGVGSSRLVLEALAPTEEEEADGLCLCDLVMYSVLSESSPETVNETVQRLVDSKTRAVIVADHCDLETHRILSGMVSRPGSRASLVTIDYDVSSDVSGDGTIKIENAPESVGEGIIDHIAPGLPSLDRRRLAHFAKGYPKIVSRIAEVRGSGISIANATDADLVDAFVQGRYPMDPGQLMRSAQLLAVFGLLGIEPPLDGQLEEVAALGSNLSAEDLYAAIVDLADRSVAQRRGRTVVFHPRPIALNLALRQWKQWRQETRIKVLAGDTSVGLKVLAARQLALLDTTDIARDVLEVLCQQGGPLDSWERISAEGHAEVLSALAEIDPRLVVDLIERVFDGLADLTVVDGDTRRRLVVALEKTSFDPATFKDSARLLLDLALAENETWANNATGQFAGLFPMILGGTAADGETRLTMLKEAAAVEDPAQREIVANALIAGTETIHFTRVIGAETRGSRPSMESWRPATNDVAMEYVGGCVRLLCELSLAPDAVGSASRAKLGVALYALTVSGFIDVVEETVRKVVKQGHYWPQAMASLRNVLAYHVDSVGQQTADRVRDLIDGLEPRTLQARVQSLVTESPWNFAHHDEADPAIRMQRHAEEVCGLAAELLEQPETLLELLPQLSRGQHGMTFAFGQNLATHAAYPLEFLSLVVQCTVDIPLDERNYDVLSGFLTGLAQRDRNAVEVFKKKAVRSPDLAPILPPVCSYEGISGSDILLVIDALKAGTLPPWRLNRWSLGGVLTKVPATAVAQLLDAMFDHSADGFAEAVELMGMYAYPEAERLDQLRPQVLRLAKNAAGLTVPGIRSHNRQRMDEHHFNRIMDWMLSKGRQDPDAVSTSLVLARGLADIDGMGSESLLGPLVPKLLADFPETVWPLIGQAILSADARRSFLLRGILGDPRPFGRTANSIILQLPEETLFAWCHANPDRAPAFVSAIAPVLTSYDKDENSQRRIHPVMARLLDEFGEREDVRRAIENNIHTFGWSGSVSTYFTLYQGPLNGLVDHSNPRVRSWARSLLRYLESAIKKSRDEDEELEAYDEAHGGV